MNKIPHCKTCTCYQEDTQPIQSIQRIKTTCYNCNDDDKIECLNCSHRLCIYYNSCCGINCFTCGQGPYCNDCYKYDPKYPNVQRFCLCPYCYERYSL